MGDPALSVAHPKHGRLYRWPGSDLPATMRRGQMDTAIRDGLLVPSITNIIDTRDKPHLNRWHARLAADAAMTTFAKFPVSAMNNPTAARTHIMDAANRSLVASQLRGTAVHEACEAVGRGLPVPEGLTGDEQACLRSWDAFVQTWQPEWLHLECTVFGEIDGHRYAGTGDFIARVRNLVICGDYKTNKHGLHADVASQLSAIAHAHTLVTDAGEQVPMPQIDAGLAVHLNADGYQACPVELDGGAWDVFRHLLAVWAWHKSDGDGSLTDGKRTVGVALHGPDALLPSPGRGPSTANR